MTGIAMLAVGIGIAGALLFTGVDRFWRIILFFPFWIGALGIFQAKEKT